MGKYKYNRSNHQKRMVITIINFIVGYFIGIGFQKVANSKDGTVEQWDEDEKRGANIMAMIISYLVGFGIFRFCQSYVKPLQLEKR